VDGIGRTRIQKEEVELAKYLIERLSGIPSITIYPSEGSIVSFSVKNHHPHDVAQVLSDHGVMVRAGNHCAAPLSTSLHEAGTVRVSFGVGNTKEDIDALLEALKYVG
jgi:cysteine desulfurase/selenocysteine lyase